MGMFSKNGNHKILWSVGVASGLVAMRAWQSRSYDLRGKTVFITGGSRGLGLILAREFASRGARVAISARDREALQRAEADLRSRSESILALETDITMREEADTALDQIRRKFGPVDVLVNNAGTICVGPLEVMTINEFRDSLNTHFWGPYFTTMAVLPEMRLAPLLCGEICSDRIFGRLARRTAQGQHSRDHRLSRTDAHGEPAKRALQGQQRS
jgi:NAD(P)-dependent dehydrogenase (short-subunit alcohol dehydrogenase family)